MKGGYQFSTKDFSSRTIKRHRNRYGETMEEEPKSDGKRKEKSKAENLVVNSDDISTSEAEGKMYSSSVFTHFEGIEQIRDIVKEVSIKVENEEKEAEAKKPSESILIKVGRLLIK